MKQDTSIKILKYFMTMTITVALLKKTQLILNLVAFLL